MMLNLCVTTVDIGWSWLMMVRLMQWLLHVVAIINDGSLPALQVQAFLGFSTGGAPCKLLILKSSQHFNIMIKQDTIVNHHYSSLIVISHNEPSQTIATNFINLHWFINCNRPLSIIKSLLLTNQFPLYCYSDSPLHDPPGPRGLNQDTRIGHTQPTRHPLRLFKLVPSAIKAWYQVAHDFELWLPLRLGGPSAVANMPNNHGFRRFKNG